MRLKKIAIVFLLPLFCACTTGKRLAVKFQKSKDAGPSTPTSPYNPPPTIELSPTSITGTATTVIPPFLQPPLPTPMPAPIPVFLIEGHDAGAEIVGGGRTRGLYYREGSDDCLTDKGCDGYGKVEIDPQTGDLRCPAWAETKFTSSGPEHGPEYFVCLARRKGPSPVGPVLCGGGRAMGKLHPLNDGQLAQDNSARPIYDSKNCVLPSGDNTCNRWDLGGCTVVTNAERGDVDCAPGTTTLRWSDNLTYRGCARIQPLVPSHIFPGYVGDIVGGSLDSHGSLWGCADRNGCPRGTQFVPTSERPTKQFICVVTE